LDIVPQSLKKRCPDGGLTLAELSRNVLSLEKGKEKVGLRPQSRGSLPGIYRFVVEN
jgi:hypothetical protein